MNRRKFIKSLLYAGLGTGLIASYSLVFERYLIRENHYRINIKNLPKEFAGLTILQLTDIHYGLLDPRVLVEHIIDLANSIEKDIIVCTGDYVRKKNITQEIDTVWPMMQKLKAPMGVYAVLGNHDHWVNSKHSLYWLEKSGLSIRHKTISFERNGKRIWLGGAGDLWEDELKIDETFSGIDENDFKIVLAHNPDTADRREIKTKIDLYISGHTHGGQINLPLIGPPYLPVKNRKFASGFVKTKKTSVFVCRGIGWAILPVRFNCPAEIAVLHLYPDNPD